MIKKDVLGKASSLSLSEAHRCGECLHFKQHAHSSRQKVCSLEGVRAVGIAPKCFTPDVTRIAKNSDEFIQIAAMLHALTTQQKRTLLALLRTPRKAKKRYPMGTRLYFKVGRDYVSNYLCAYVMGYTSSGELMLMGSPDRKTRGTSFVTYLSSTDGLLQFSEWKVKRAELKAANHLYDPLNKIIKKSSVVDDYEPLTIDSVPRDYYDKQKPKRIRKDTYEFQVSGD